jgi:hypothetical protein
LAERLNRRFCDGDSGDEPCESVPDEYRITTTRGEYMIDLCATHAEPLRELMFRGRAVVPRRRPMYNEGPQPFVRTPVHLHSEDPQVP